MKINEIYSDILTEAQNYEDMFSKITQIMDQHGKNDSATFIKKSIDNDIKRAKSSLKRVDRITWWLRIVKISLIDDILAMNFIPSEIKEILRKDKEKISKKANITGRVIPDATLRQLEHFLSLPIPKIQDYVFTTQSLIDIKEDFEDYEEEWRNKSVDDGVKIQDGDKIILEFDGGQKAWWMLDRASCDAEGKIMAHCGNNQHGANPNDKILSFRTSTDNPNIWVPHLTFILDDEGYLGEMKGRANAKPAEKYHPYIVELLKSKYIEGIKGGGYQPENNFSLNDLPSDVRENLIKINPSLASLWDVYQKEGLSDRTKRLIYSELDRYNVPNIDSFSSNDSYAVMQNIGDFDMLLRELEYTHDFFKNVKKFIDDSEDDLTNDQINDMADELTIDNETYIRIIEKLSDTTLGKITKDLDIDFDYNDYTDREQLAELLDNSKYESIFRTAIIKQYEELIKGLSNDEDFERFKQLVIEVANYSSMIGSMYIDSSDMENIKIEMSMNDFIQQLSSFNADDEYYEENFIRDYSGASDYVERFVEDHNVDDTIENENFLSDDDDIRIFKKYNNMIKSGSLHDISNLTLDTLNFSDVANMIEREMVMNDSKDVTRLKMLAGLI